MRGACRRGRAAAKVPGACQLSGGKAPLRKIRSPNQGVMAADSGLPAPSPEHRDHLLLLVPNQPHMLSFPSRMPFLCLPPQHTAHTWPPWEPPQALARPFRWPYEGLLLGGEGTCK